MNRRTSLSLVLTAWLVPAATLLCAQVPAPAVVPGAAEALAPVKARFAPDKRITVFDVAVERTAAGVVATGDVEDTSARDAITKALEDAGLGPVTNHVTVLPDPALGTARFGIVRVSVANVRSRPAHSAEMATQTLMGWTVRILEQQSGWYYVHTEPDGYLGWIEELQLTVLDKAGLEAWTHAPRVIVTTPFATVVEQPTAEATPVTDVVAGALLQSTARTAAWTTVALADGRRGFVPSVSAEALDSWTASRQPTGNNIERTALRFMGVPYLWGGMSSKGLDCSGYAKTVFRLNGIELPRDANQQALEGTPVPVDDQLTSLVKGDLVFFGAKATATTPERISHVAIYIGNGEILHASGLVRRNSLLPGSPIYSESLRNKLVCVRRQQLRE
jgi:gamma-D-glutamyl-L-lysine dipeptidyl-peptidase